MSYRFAFLILGSLALIACGDDDGGSGSTTTTTTTTHEHDPEEHICEHLNDTTVTAVAATADAAMAPVEELDHVTYEITLADDGSGSYVGFMGLTVVDAQEYVMFLTEDVPLAVQDDAGGAVTIADDCTADPCSEACADIAGRYDAAFEAATYTLSFGPTTESTFRLVIATASHAR